MSPSCHLLHCSWCPPPSTGVRTYPTPSPFPVGVVHLAQGALQSPLKMQITVSQAGYPPKTDNNKKKLKRSSCKHLKNTVVQDEDTPPPATFLHQIPSGLCSLGSNPASHHTKHSVIHQPKRTLGNSAYVRCSCQSVSLCTERERESRDLRQWTD